MADFDKFLYTYIVFLAFFIFIVGMGAKEFFVGDDTYLLAYQSEFPSLNPNATFEQESTQSGNLLIGFLDWLRSGFIDVTGLDAAGWMETTFGPFHSFVDNIWLFIKIAAINPGVGYVAALVFTPAAIFAVYGVLRLIRGGG